MPWAETEPLAARMRPQNLAEFVGQSHLIGDNKPLAQLIKRGRLHSAILWGPPGTGKTTFAHLLANSVNARFEELSAVFSGVKEIRAVMERAEQALKKGQATVLFVDEIHRFSKSQQDVFLPYVEKGVVILIGATTENPSFELNSALLSRARVYVLKQLSSEELLLVLKRALHDSERGLGQSGVHLSDDMLEKLALMADGDARRALTLLEIVVQYAEVAGQTEVNDALLSEAFGENLRRFDKGGEAFYNQISALHKSVRGSAPDAAIYWFARMIEGGCDPLYLARRVVRMASEDIGNADPRALTLALNACETYERLGSPEGELAIAQAILYCACAAKSNAVYEAYNEAMAEVRRQPSFEVPVHLCNAPTKLLKQLGYGKNYRYAHDEPEAYAAGERYFPEGMPEQNFYRPKPRGLELQIIEKLKHLRELDHQKKEKK